MVNVTKGILVEWQVDLKNSKIFSFQRINRIICEFILSDAAMKQLLLHLDETHALGNKFIVQDLDETHLFIAPEYLEVLQTRIDDLMDKISFPLAEREID